jgi:hypothetical protein
MSTYNLLMQDIWLLPVQLAIIAMALLLRSRTSAFTASPCQIALAAALVVLLCYAGHYVVLLGYDLSRDEQMAVFDSRIYAHGLLAWPLPPEWQRFASALNLGFMLPVQQPIAWVSSYLPGNAMLRAIVGSIADPALTGPLLSGLSLPLMWLCARRLWPEVGAASREVATVAVLLLATSGQFIIDGMTAYAMPAHLFANLLWLALFLRRSWWADGAALAVGLIATGLHQPVFHPLFAAPWLFGLLLHREWRRLALFTAGYGAIAAFWLYWPGMIIELVAGPHSTIATGVSLTERLATPAAHSGWYNVAKMALNMLRFFCWQNPLLPLLMLAGLVLAPRDYRVVGLLGSFLLPFVVMALIIPDQGHGFGYRYLHGAIGSAVLLAAIGWQRLRALWPRWDGAMVRASLLTVLLLLPMQTVMAHRLYRPFAAASARIDASGAHYAIIGANDGPYARDLVLNRPDLSNRPIRLSYEMAGDFAALAGMICRPGGVVVALPTDRFFADMERELRHYRNRERTLPSQRMASEQHILHDAGCATRLLD